MQNQQKEVWIKPSEMTMDPIAEAIRDAASLIAEAIHANAEATVLLARATAGEFEPGDEPQREQYLDGC